MDDYLLALNSEYEAKFTIKLAQRCFQAMTNFKLYSKAGMSWEKFAEQKERARRDYHSFTKHPLQVLERRKR